MTYNVNLIGVTYACLSMLWCYAIVSVKGRRFGSIKTFNPAANVCTCPKSGIWCTVVAVCLCNLYVFLVSRFFYRLDRWFSRLNGLTLVILGPFIACCLVWAKDPCWRPYIDLYWFTFLKLLFGWSVVSLAVTPYRPISMSLW